MSNLDHRSVRRHDLDWVRVLAFYLLIVFHIAVGFVDWRVYPYFNNQTAGLPLTYFLDFVHQWRLPVLFLISGMGTSYAFRRRTGKTFVIERSQRLLIPLLFSMYFVIIIQAYFMALELGLFEGGFFAFIPVYVSIIPDTQHLWFLVNLFAYSILFTPLFILLRNRPDNLIMKLMQKMIGLANGWGILWLIPVPLILVEILIKPVYGGYLGQGYEFPWYLLFFVVGYLLVSAGEVYWNTLEKIRYKSLLLGIVFSVLLFGLRDHANTISPEYGSLILIGGWTAYGVPFWTEISFVMTIVHALNAWAWCMVAFSWAAKYLNKPSRRLTSINRSVYPFYLVHQTFVLVSLYYLKDVSIAWQVKFVMITVITFAGCFAVFEIVKRTHLTRMLFGIKPLHHTDQQKTSLPVAANLSRTASNISK